MAKALNLQHVTRHRPQADCQGCGHNLPAEGDKHYVCPNCGNRGVHLNRERIPFDVWMTLADNEDSEGRVPADPGWKPT